MGLWLFVRVESFEPTLSYPLFRPNSGILVRTVCSNTRSKTADWPDSHSRCHSDEDGCLMALYVASILLFESGIGWL